MTIARSSNKRGDYIAVAVTEGHNFVAFEVLVSAEAKIIAALFCRCSCTITVNDTDVEVLFLVQ